MCIPGCSGQADGVEAQERALLDHCRPTREEIAVVPRTGHEPTEVVRVARDLFVALAEGLGELPGVGPPQLDVPAPWSMNAIRV